MVGVVTPGFYQWWPGMGHSDRRHRRSCHVLACLISSTENPAKIGYYIKKGKLKMALQTAVRYGPVQRMSVFRDEEDNLPKDPRQWSREHVAQWLSLVTQQHGLPEVPSSRFMMNGKALCLMSLNMFLSRVPLGGKLLYKDFQLRLCAALYSVNH